MADDWTGLTDGELAEIAQDGLQGQGAPVEAMRRLRIAIEQSSIKSDIYSRRMFVLNILLAVLTFVQAITVVPLIKSWFF